jgi:hypothetical protein
MATRPVYRIGSSGASYRHSAAWRALQVRFGAFPRHRAGQHRAPPWEGVAPTAGSTSAPDLVANCCDCGLYRPDDLYAVGIWPRSSQPPPGSTWPEEASGSQLIESNERDVRPSGAGSRSPFQILCCDAQNRHVSKVSLPLPSIVPTQRLTRKF